MQLNNLSISFGNQELFNNVNLIITKNQKVGIVGVNGAGKTTFFKIIMGMLEPDSGKVILENNARVEWLPQILDNDVDNMDIKVMDYLLLGRPIEKLSNKLQNLYEIIAIETNDKKQKELYKKIDNTQKQLEYWNYYSAESELLKIIDGMNISLDILEQPLKTLSGGQKSKIAFAKLLYSKPELILLDEPTNHLDEQSKRYVIDYLKNYKGSVYIISHDISFLDEVTTQTLFLDSRTKMMELYNGNYTAYKRLSREHEKSLIQQAEIQEREEKNLRSIIGLYTNSSGNRKKMAQDREKKLEKLLANKIEINKVQKQAKIEMKSNRESSIIPLKVENLSFKYDKNINHNIISNLSFELIKGEKFLIVGQNGVGKSTLLKLIINQLTPDSGYIYIGPKTDIGYYAQEHELLNEEKNIIDNFSDIDASDRQLRSVLGRFLFFGNSVFKKVNVLSPGEKSRVALAKLSLIGANFLLLDEPTNHLDPETQKIIAETFKTFQGTMLIVSHNPEFVDNLGIERMLILPSGEITYYNKEKVEYYQNLNKTS